MKRLGNSCAGLAAKKVLTFILVVNPPSRGGSEETPCGSNRRFTVAIVVAGEMLDEAGEGRTKAPVCAAETVIFPSFPENIPFLKDFVFDNT